MKTYAMSMTKFAIEDADDQEEEDALDQEVVAVLDRAQGQRPEAGVREHDLDDDRAGDHRAECEREPGDLREQAFR